MMRHVTLFRVFLLLILGLALLCCLIPKHDGAASVWLRCLCVADALCLIGLNTLSMLRLSIAIIRKRLNYEEHGSALAVVLSTQALLILSALAFGPIC